MASISAGTSSMRWRMAPVSSSLSEWLGCCFQLIFVMSLGILLLARADAASVNRSQEVSALLNFRDANNGTIYGGYWLSWKETDETPCDWFGVTCSENFTVEQLYFSRWGLLLFSLEGLYDLKGLSMLDLSSSIIEVPLHNLGIGNLTALTRLDLSSSSVYGAVPASISACQNLRFLDLENNLLSALPPRMSDLVNLKHLSLANNRFTGPFPIEELGNLSSLISLDLSNNSFSGDIPSLPNLTSLVVLNLNYNNLTGFEEPWYLGAAGTLETLAVSSNYLQGTIPATVTNLPNLRFLNMSGNNLSGRIPPGLSRLMNHTVTTLDLSQNQLVDEIPTDILVQSNSDAFYSFINLSYNRLTGNIPLDGSKPLTILYLDLSHNNLSGPVPSIIFNHTKSAVIDLLLNDNQLSGDIIDVFFSGPGLVGASTLRLDNNLFTGDLSRMVNTSLSFPQFVELDFSNNNLQWSTSEVIPDPIAAVLQVLTNYSSSLQEFRAGGNNFSGTPLPAACFVYSSTTTELLVFDLTNSHLQGHILGAAFDNTCLPSIQLLNLSNNHATGPLSESVINHQQGFIIDVSNNLLSGLLPVIQPSSNLYNPKYFAGNDGLCGDPLPPCAHRKRSIQWWLLLIIIGASVTSVTGSCFVASWRLRGYRKQHQQDADLIRTLLERDSATLMPLRELKKATNDFADNAQIGEGGFGTVYTGRLNDGTRVAIKRSKREGSENDKAQFLNEVRILSQVSHRNLVKLLGCCMENKIALLVFEFISNGTLQEHLQGKQGPVRLNWKQRLHIAVQTADALHYLHSMASSPIYHRDVKSANILLDENLNAKVADFGISKLAPLNATHVSTVAIQGTLGYIDPDYYSSYQLTDKSDVYSFGVVLLELISAKAALDLQRGGEEASLVYLARSYIERENLEGFTDPALSSEMFDDDGCKSMILTVGKIALKCVDVRARSRPSMYDVLKELENLSDDLVSTSKQVYPSINEETSEDLQSDEICLFDTSSTNSSSFGMQGGGNGLLFDTSSTNSSSSVMQGDGNGIQMTQISGPLSLKRGSMLK